MKHARKGLFVILLFTPIVLTNIVSFTSSPIQYRKSFTLSATTMHDPIRITDESNFTTLGFPGEGTVSTPYLITGFEIISPDGGPCISISGDSIRDTYVTISNCVISGSRGHYVEDSSIFLDRGRASIDGCRITNSTCGIYINTRDAFISNTEILGSTVNGLYLQGSNIAISNITVESAYEARSVYLNGVFDVMFEQSDISTGTMRINNVGNVSIHSSTFSNLYEITVGDNRDEVIINGSTFNDCSLYVYATATDVTITNNHFEGFQQRVLPRLAPLYIRGNRTIVSRNTFHTELDITDTLRKIAIIDYSENNSFTFNKILNYPRGIWTMNEEGIDRDPLSSGATIHNNSFYSCGYALFCDGVGAVISNNSISASYGVGVNMTAVSESNKFYYNHIVGNNMSASDDGTNNTWDDGVSAGNYWGDYNGTGTYPIPGIAESVDNYPMVWIPPTSTTTETGDMMLYLAISGIGTCVVVIVAAIVLKNRRP